MMADVMTDTDCTPDAQMISRCRNVMRLEDGRQIVLRHPHNMTRIPCLAPGERVRLIPTRAKTPEGSLRSQDQWGGSGR